MNNELFLGQRITFNDKQSTNIIAGFVMDTLLDTRIYTLQFNRRLNSGWKMQLEAKIFNNVDVDDSLYSNKKDRYIQASLNNYF